MNHRCCSSLILLVLTEDRRSAACKHKVTWFWAVFIQHVTSGALTGQGHMMDLQMAVREQRGRHLHGSQETPDGGIYRLTVTCSVGSRRLTTCCLPSEYHRAICASRGQQVNPRARRQQPCSHLGPLQPFKATAHTWKCPQMSVNEENVVFSAVTGC